MKFFNKLSDEIAAYLAVKIWFSPMPQKANKKYYHLTERRSYKKRSINGGLELDTWKGAEAQSVVVLLHGWGGCKTQFTSLIETLLSQKYSVVSFSFPAHGESERFSSDFNEYVKVIKSIDAMFAQPKVYICHSFGFLILARLVLDRILSAKSVVAINSPHRFEYILQRFSSKLKISESISKRMIKYINQRNRINTAEATTINIESLMRETNLLFIADEDDKEVSFSEHNYFQHKLENNFYSTRGLGHNRILNNKDVHRKILTFIN